MQNRDKSACQITKVTGSKALATEDIVVQEISLSLFYNGEKLVTLFCSPFQIDELALGFLLSEGLISESSEIHTLKYIPDVQCVFIEGPEIEALSPNSVSSSCCGKSRPGFDLSSDLAFAEPLQSSLQISLSDIYYYADYLQNHLPLFQETGGIHSGGIGQNGEVLFTSYDIGRHNVFDKLFGNAFKQKLSLRDHIAFFSGRVSSEILSKVAKMQIPILIARSAPTNLALAYAEDLNITVAGFARGNRVNIYTKPERIILPD